MSSVYQIEDLVLDTGRQQLTRGGASIHLGPLSYRFLLALVEAAPDVVSHDALAATVWYGRVVSPETIIQRGKLLRDALGDDPQQPRYLEVLRGRGYRLIPPVVPLPVAERPARLPRPVVAVAALLMLGIAAAVWRLDSREPAPAPSPSIAVLPFADMSPARDQQYLADGIAEEILNLLSGTTSLKVIARTSSFAFKDGNADIDTIAKKLDVTHLIEGSVRRSEDRVRVSVQLIGAADGAHLWSQSYDRQARDILQLQHEIAAAIAAALEVELLGRTSPARSAVTRVNPEAFDAYLRGRQQMQMHNYAEAENHLKQALDLDPEFLPAYGNLGLVYVLEILDVRAPLADNREKLRRIVQQGLAIAPDDPSLIGLSGQLARYDGEMELAEQRLRRALARDPANVPIALLYAMFKLDQGHAHEALQVALQLLRRDPLNSMLHILAWGCHMDLGNAPDAMDAAMRINEVVGVPSSVAFDLRGWARAVLEGDLVGSVEDGERAAAIGTDHRARAYAWPVLYYDLLDMATGDAALAPYSPEEMLFPRAYGYLARDDVAKARELALLAVSPRKQGWSASYDDPAKVRLATDALIASGDAGRAVELIERMAPVYAGYRLRRPIDAAEFSPAPYAVRGTSSTYPALYFPDYIRALRAAGDPAGAENMLRHLEAILTLRRARGLFTEERHAAEMRALRGDFEGALDALEQAERDRTIYGLWHLYLGHNEIFADIRDHPRFEALLARVEDEMRRQGAELARRATTQ